MHWSEQHVAFVRTIVPEIRDTPVYLLTADETGRDWHPRHMAAFSPLGDIQDRSTLENLGLWQGRGIVILFRSDFSEWCQRTKIGTVCHELAHALEYLASPYRQSDELSPVAEEFLRRGEDVMLHEEGIDRKQLVRTQHGSSFIRLCCHLYTRARREIMIAPADIHFLDSQYSLPESKFNDVMESLNSELAMSRNLSLRQLKEPPGEFMALFEGDI